MRQDDGPDRSEQPAVEFVIIGGFALSAHGVIRGTKDIDIVPDPGSGNIGRLAGALRALGDPELLDREVGCRVRDLRAASSP